MAPIALNRRYLLALAGAIQLVALPRWAGAQTPPDDAVAERRVKAAYLYRFAGYTEWPAAALGQADAPLQIGVWGHNDLANDLKALVTGRRVGDRLIQVKPIDSAAAASGVHMLFIAHPASARLAAAAATLRMRPVLIVTESPGALGEGSVINFLMVNGHVRFELSPDAADRHGLRLSSRLIAVSHNLSSKAP